MDRPQEELMRKIPTVYLRDFDGNPKYVTREPNPECAWVFAGEGVATRKYDGTCVMLDDDGRWWARREVKPGKDIPPNWVLADHDAETGKAMGWEPIEQSSFAKLHAEALTWLTDMEPGTYELIGPKINGNPERAPHHDLVFHDATIINTDAPVPLDFDGLRAWLHAHPFEGIVWHGPDGRYAKLKARDFPKGDR
jgi:hypothetical protein